MTRCRYGFGQRWACHQVASVEVVFTWGAHEKYCAYHAKRAAKVAERIDIRKEAHR